MKTLPFLSTLTAATFLVAPGAAFAVDVQITFQNLHASQNATYSTLGSGEAYTYANANPPPDTTVPPGSSDVYVVGNPATDLVTGAHVRYTIGSKRCIFHTSYTGTPTYTPNGNVIIPNWTKSYESSGGAICTATITYTNPSTFDWAVTFTMK
ncbi:MAG: hypothetical protein LBF51_08565 [Zoogloeaceae bacterium]|jgi:hypothetical protein|nr:hypothetical protein [Zoogloeaceae bacterium]